MEKVYQKLKAYCQLRGYDFQVVDMRWGVRDEATDDHMTSELCMKELKACQKLSTGPNFIVRCCFFGTLLVCKLFNETHAIVQECTGTHPTCPTYLIFRAAYLSILLLVSDEIDRLYFQVKWKAHDQWFGSKLTLQSSHCTVLLNILYPSIVDSFCK